MVTFTASQIVLESFGIFIWESFESGDIAYVTEQVKKVLTKLKEWIIFRGWYDVTENLASCSASYNISIPMSKLL